MGEGIRLTSDIKLELERMAKNMRRNALQMGYNAGANGAHWGGGFSSIEILAVLYGVVMNISKENLSSSNRDRFIISKAHGVLAYYTALYEKGIITREQLMSYEQDGSDFAGHPVRNLEYGIEFSGGSLGLGPGLGIGVAIAGKKRGLDYRVFVLLGDGECAEGSVWEALVAAPNFSLDNLVMIIDFNRLQYDGPCDEIMKLNGFDSVCKNLGWSVERVDGHDVEALYNAFVARDDKPRLIIAETVKGKGVSFMENNKYWHHGTLSEEQYNQAKKELEG